MLEVTRRREKTRPLGILVGSQMLSKLPLVPARTRAACRLPRATPSLARGISCQSCIATRACNSTAEQQAAMVEPAAAGGGVTASTGNNLRKELEELYAQSLASAFPDVNEVPLVAPTPNPKFGDYQCNNAMGLFNRIKGRDGAPKTPRDVANALIAGLPANDIIVETSLAGPGFINMRIGKPYLSRRVNDLLKHGTQTLAPKLPYRRVIVDFSSPNVAKEMHVGHLRSTIIGDTIARTLEFCGCDVLRLNHIGDWGTQFGMLIQYMAELRPEGLAASKDEDVADLQKLYKAAKVRFDEDEEFKTRAREAVTRLQSGDTECITAWQRICEASRKEFQAIYDRLGVKLIERGESFYNPMLTDVVEELRSLKVAELSQGATCVFVEGVEVPLIVQKSDGGFGYASTDMAAIKQRVQDEKADWVIYVTDIGQAQHFDMVFKAARRAGYLPPEGELPRVSHVGFGLVMGEDGKKFKTRSGDVVRLVELLDEAKARCVDTIRTRREAEGEQVDEAELQAAACAMGYGAVKYADLKNSRLTNYKFSFDAMLNLNGNTAVYLLYAHARIASIGRKANRDIDALVAAVAAGGDSGPRVEVEHPKEVLLAMHLVRFPEALEEMLAELTPNRLTDYVYALSDYFSGFYTECKVVGSPQEDSRLLLCEATARVMRQCFYLLGITPLYKI